MSRRRARRRGRPARGRAGHVGRGSVLLAHRGGATRAPRQGSVAGRAAATVAAGPARRVTAGQRGVAELHDGLPERRYSQRDTGDEDHARQHGRRPHPRDAVDPAWPRPRRRVGRHVPGALRKQPQPRPRHNAKHRKRVSPRPVAVPDKVPGPVHCADCHAYQPWLWLVVFGPGTDSLEAVNTGLDLAERSMQRTPQRVFQAVLGCGHALTQPARRLIGSPAPRST